MSPQTPAQKTSARRRAVVLAVVVVSSLSVAGCADEGGIAFTNSADVVVSVRSADETVSDVHPDGGVVVLSDDCLEGPLVVTYPGGDEVTFDAPLCPGQELLIGDDSVQVVAPSSG